MTTELIDEGGQILRRLDGRGGARANAGRKPNGYMKPEEAISYDKAKARKETALADTYELDYKIKSGQYVARSAVKQASATVMAVLSQTARSLADNLERRGVPPTICVQIDEAVTEALAETAKSLEAIWRQETADHPDDNSDLF